MYDKKDAAAPGVGYLDLKLMQGCPPPQDKLIDLRNWDSPPYNRWSFQHMSELFPVAPIRRGNAPVSELLRATRSLDGVRFERVDGQQTDLATFLTDSYTDGLIVLHRGEVVSEHYFNGMQPHTLHLLQSVSKTLVASLVGILIGQGKIDPDARVSDYVSDLSGCDYGDARIQDVLDMRTGIQFCEDYTNPDAEFIQLDIASGWRERGTRTSPDTIYGLLASLKKGREHGGHFEYRSVETDVLGWVCERVCDERLPVLLSREIWARLGAEQDANITLDRVGTALADGGISASLRDLARFAQMHLQGGMFNGQQIVPEAFIKASRQGSGEHFRVLYDDFAGHYPKAAYSNQCWVHDSDKGIYSARGVFGQFIYVDPQSDVSIVKFSTWPDFLNPEWSLNSNRAFEAIAKALAD